MRIGSWAGLMAAAALMAGCGDFWQAPNNGSTSFSLSNSGSIAVTQGSSSTDTITVTPGSSFTGTVSLACAVTSRPSGASSSTDPTCAFSDSSLTFSSSTAATSTLTASASSSTPIGAYQMKVTGTSGSVAAYTTFCVAVGTSTSNCTATTSGNFYILNASTLTGYTISSTTMTAISGASATFTQATAMALDSTGSYLFVASDNGITPFTINTSTGALTKGTPFDTTNSSIEALAVDPADRWLLAASSAGILTAYPLSSGASTGGTAYSQSLNLGSGSIYGVAVSPSGYSNDDIVAVAMGSAGTGLFTFTSSAATGPLSAEGSILPPIGSGSATAVAVDPQNRLLYIGETNSYTTSGYEGALRVYTIGSTGVSPLSTYTPAGSGPHAILPSKDGSYLYAASWNTTDGITGYSVTASALTALGSPIAAGSEPSGLAEDSTNGFVLGISYGGAPTFDAYALSSGTLTLSTSNSTVSSPIAIVAVP